MVISIMPSDDTTSRLDHLTKWQWIQQELHSQLLLNRLTQVRIIHNRIQRYLTGKLLIKVRRINSARLRRQIQSSIG